MLSPELILKHVHGFWVSAALAASIKQGIFEELDTAKLRASELASRLSIPVRSVQALLDALLGMELVVNEAGVYSNSPAASKYLVKSKDDYMGGYATMIQSTWRHWEQLPAAVASGKPLNMQESANPGNTFWEDLVPAIAPLAFIPARATAERLGIAKLPEWSMLDIAGGSGAYAATWLSLNPRGHATQIDWPNVNAIAERYVHDFGVGDRFTTLDGDMERLDLGRARYDYIVYASVAHGISPERNVAMFTRIRAALKPGGRLIIVGTVPNEDRTGNPLVLLFNVNMLLNTEQGKTYVRSDFSRWLMDAGFSNIDFQSLSEMPYTIIYAS